MVKITNVSYFPNILKSYQYLNNEGTNQIIRIRKLTFTEEKYKQVYNYR